jgi:beta-lactamase regulating signal transducer with metallopeptidase domain
MKTLQRVQVSSETATMVLAVGLASGLTGLLSQVKLAWANRDDGFADSMIWLAVMVAAAIAVAVVIYNVIITKGNSVSNSITSAP